MLEDIQDTYGKEASSLDAVLRFAGSDVLILDDFGKVRVRVVGVDALQIQPPLRGHEAPHRHVAVRPHRLGEADRAPRGHESARAIVSRLRQMCHVIELSGS